MQPTKQSAFGYQRAAKALASGIDRSVVDLIEEGTLRDVPYIGASSERVVSELVRTGRSATVDARLETSTKRHEVEKRRRFRRASLSRHALRLALDAALPAAIVSTHEYLGDLQLH